MDSGSAEIRMEIKDEYFLPPIGLVCQPEAEHDEIN